MGNWTIEEKSRNVHIIRMPIQRNADWEQRVLVTSDRHWDNPHSDHKLQYDHLQKAKECGAPVIDLGDFFDVMSGRNDRRGTKGHVRPEHKVDNYFDAVVDTAVDAFKPYAANFAVLAHGNHDTAIIKHGETDLLSRFVYRLNAETGSRAFTGGYSGFVRFMSEDESGGAFRRSVNLFYHHGHGGGGPVTKGTIHASRRAVYLPDADIVVSGHHHENWLFPMQRTRLSDTGKVYKDQQLHIACSTYKDEYGDGAEGWHIERGGPPKPIGAVWLAFRWDRPSTRIRYTAQLDTKW
jgi:predicted phosphodiesterase